MGVLSIWVHLAILPQGFKCVCVCVCSAAISHPYRCLFLSLFCPRGILFLPVQWLPAENGLLVQSSSQSQNALSPRCRAQPESVKFTITLGLKSQVHLIIIMTFHGFPLSVNEYYPNAQILLSPLKFGTISLPVSSSLPCHVTWLWAWVVALCTPLSVLSAIHLLIPSVSLICLW